MFTVIGTMLLTAAVAVMAVRLYRAVHGWEDFSEMVVVLSRGRDQQSRAVHQRGFVRTPGKSTRDRLPSRDGGGKKASNPQIRKPWGW